MDVKFRRVPGYFNSSTYWFDRLDAANMPTLIGTVKKVSSGGWHMSPTWRADHKDGELRAFGRTRTEAVTHLLRKIDSAEEVA